MKKYIVLVSVTLVLATTAFCFIEPGFYIFKKYKDVTVKPVNNNNTIVYLINLDRSKDRLNAIMPLIKKLNLPFKRISGIDGQKLTASQIDAVIDKNFLYYGELPPTKGNIGCYMSHQNAFQELIDSDYQNALILEDDAVFDPKKLSELINILTHKYPDKWDFNIFGKYKNSSGKYKGFNLPIQKLDNGYHLNIEFANIAGAHCYIINRKTAGKLLEKSYPLKIPLDLYYNRPWEFDIKLRTSEPFIAKLARTESVSGGTDMVTGLYKPDSSIKPRKIFALKTKIIRTLYSTKVYLQEKFQSKTKDLF